MAHISFEGLSFSYPNSSNNALEDINLTIEKGEYICLCGPSGCGKTTLLRQMKMVLAPVGERTGLVLFDGIPLDDIDLRTQSMQIGFVMQDPDAQIVTDLVWHELAFGLENLGVDQGIMRLRVAEMASYFGIESWLHRNVSELSGGQKQLLNLASIMAMHPSVLVLDEPTSQLDPIAASDFLNTIRKINVELGTTIIISEHRLENLFSVSDKIVVMESGRIVANGAPRDVAMSLISQNSEMTVALPSPVRIYNGVIGALRTKPTDREIDTCPITVREGRTWLESYVREFKPTSRSISEGLSMNCEQPLAIEMKDIWFRYAREDEDILRGADLAIRKGSITAIMGANGAGKSTLLKVISYICRPYRGSVRIFGQKDYTKGMAMLPQDPKNLFVKDSVKAELEEMLSPHVHDNPKMAERITQVAQTCRIEKLLASNPLDISGGEQQRVALAKVLLTDPQILLLDEPTKGLDPFFKRELARMLENLREDGVTVVIVSHDIEFCANCADEVSLLFDGSIASSAPPRSFFARNSFYTTVANRMSRGVFENAVTDRDVVDLCLS